MCVMCSGATVKDVVNRLHREIEDRGFAIVPVEDASEKTSWAYTIGLVDSMNHPELVVAGHPLGAAVRVLGELGQAVLGGHRLEPDDSPITFHGAAVGVVPVHQWHLHQGLIAAWHWYYDGVGRPDVEPRALQILLPDAYVCPAHQ
jgi:hypothetical protein